MDGSGYSIKCSDPQTRWSKTLSRCVSCGLEPGSAPPAPLCCASARPPSTPAADRAVPLAVLSLVVVLACLVWVKRKRGVCGIGSGRTPALDFKRTSRTNVGFSALSAPSDRTLEDMLGPAILSAPIQTILNDLDVLEDLIILLDPETKGVKNTKHLASHWGFSSARITYAYSMRDSKSPLKTVLEGVTSRHPDWTVGDVAKMLKTMERNDAIAVLARLRPDIVEV